MSEELDGDWRFEAGEERRAVRRRLADEVIADREAKRARLDALPWDGTAPMETDVEGRGPTASMARCVSWATTEEVWEYQLLPPDVPRDMLHVWGP